MTAQQINYSNFFETTLDGNVGASDTSLTLSAAPTSDGTSAISAPFYLVIDPDSATNKEVILVTASSGVTMSTVTRDVEGRHSPDISHSDGTIVRMAVVGEMFEDLHDQLTSGTITFTNKTFDADGTGNSITNIEDANIKALAAIDATKIADGSVTSAEFQYIGGLTSDAQTQLDAKLALSGGTMTGEIDLESFTETYNAGGSGSSFTVNMDNGSVYLMNVDANATVNFTNVPSGVTKTMFIRDASSTAGYTFTWQVDGVTITPKFLGGTAHVSTANYDLITFLSIGNGEYYISAQTDWS